MSLTYPEKYRKKGRPGKPGVFMVPRNGEPAPLKCIASNELEWEHVSVFLTRRCPTWDEMNRIKDIFWDEDDTVMQLHPARKDYVNNHPYCLHLWRPLKEEIPTPNRFLV